MKKSNQLLTGLLVLLTLSFVGCSKEEPTPEPEQPTYSATYTVNEISDDFFTLGSFIVAYVNKDGKEEVVNIGKAQMPFVVTVKDLKEDSELSFDLIYGYLTDTELTKEKYTFKRSVSLTINGSDGSMYSSTIKSGSLTLGKDNVKTYLDKVISEEAFESTVQKFISRK